MDQDGVNIVWKAQWQKEDAAALKDIFGHRLFVEGYPIVKKYLDETGSRVLEIGAGTGRFGLQVAKDYLDKQVIITDVLDESLDVARTLAAKLELQNVEYQKEDVSGLSFPSNSFDLVIADVVIQHIENDQRAVNEMIRVLKPGGRVIITVMNSWNIHNLYKKLRGKKYEYGYEKAYTKEELRNVLHNAGAGVIAQDGFYPAYGIYRLKKHGKVFGFLGRALNRLNRIIDPITGRIFSRHFGFEHVVVAKKN